ncbi:hypothetical protein OROHE_026530 [Orobanche hederae]
MKGDEGNEENSDLLRDFMKRSDIPNQTQQKREEEDEDGEIELSLGLSTNGRFGVDPTRNKKLRRASSIANLVLASGGAGAEIGTAGRARAAGCRRHERPLSRTQSLPVGTEEEWRRRKEMQSVRRTEARKNRMEKLKNLRVLKDSKERLSKGFDGDINGHMIGNGVLHRFGNGDLIESSSQRSVGPLRSGSSGSSELIQGTKPNAEVSPSSLEKSKEQEPSVRAPDKDAGELLKNGMFDMPYVTTKETAPNGRKIEGFLYRYKKGEDVRIVCVCHGMFLTPKEFVEHGGFSDVEHPLKRIVVSPFPLL